jgi:rubrerythrin
MNCLLNLPLGELSAICSNLAKGCEMQQLSAEAVMFKQISDHYKGIEKEPEGKEFKDAAELLKYDMREGFLRANIVAAGKSDRGALRALVWSEKVSRMVNSLLDRYLRDGDTILENKKLFVCEACGFISLSEEPPENCPVCKTQKHRFSEVEKGGFYAGF